MRAFFAAVGVVVVACFVGGINQHHGKHADVVHEQNSRNTAANTIACVDGLASCDKNAYLGLDLKR